MSVIESRHCCGSLDWARCRSSVPLSCHLPGASAQLQWRSSMSGTLCSQWDQARCRSSFLLGQFLANQFSSCEQQKDRCSCRSVEINGDEDDEVEEHTPGEGLWWRSQRHTMQQTPALVLIWAAIHRPEMAEIERQVPVIISRITMLPTCLPSLSDPCPKLDSIAWVVAAKHPLVGGSMCAQLPRTTQSRVMT